MDAKDVRKRLGLAEDASDEQVQNALREMNEAVSASSTAPADHGEQEPETQQDPPATQQEPEQEPVAAAGSQQLRLPEGTVLVDKTMWEQTQAGLTKTSTFIAKQEARDRENLVSAAIADGRIPPARKDHWVKYLETDPSGVETLAALAKGMVPVDERGHAHDMSDSNPTNAAADLETVSGWSESIFPEVKRQRQEEAAAAAGGASRTRVTRDAHYTRR